ncbi:hypothetical protein BDV93DRAFT_545196 [Ceratobasidium sp. AG-I]|nr:hypothetical protein BDV93DRAFT_545196 [Ceratobasidium sp. AG-I]
MNRNSTYKGYCELSDGNVAIFLREPIIHKKRPVFHQKGSIDRIEDSKQRKKKRRLSAWLPSKDVSRLLPHEIAAYINELSKRKGELLEGYKIANDPYEWRKTKDALAKRERDVGESGTGDDVDELDEEAEAEDDEEDADAAGGKKPKAKKRKRESTVKESAEEKKGKRKRASEQLAKQRRGKGTKKSAEHIESEDDDDKPAAEKPTSSKVEKERPNKRAKKESIAPAPAAAAADEEGDDAAMASDPEAAKVKEWRHKLQRAFLTKTAPVPEEMAGLDTVFTTVEQYDKMTVEYLSYSKIGKVMRKIIQLTNIPSDDQYHFRERAQALVTKWQQLITTSEERAAPTSTKGGSVKAGSAKASSVKPKSVNPDETKDEDAPAEPETSANGIQANGSGGAEEAMEVDKS